ncbi:MAG: MarR family winged helix-turn-helix transcriptional regulator [Pseudomonadota bacterium]
MNQNKHRGRAVGAFTAYRIERVHARLTAQGSAILKAHCDLTLRQWWIIADIAEMKPETATELSRVADVDKGLLSRNLKTLVNLGYVSMERDSRDHRQQLINLTPEGWEIYRSTLPIMNQRNEKLTKNMSGKDVDALLSSLDKIEAAASILEP